ncbi:MAG TPA: FAD-dependent oxidoreductase [Frankiaceae bacterium]|jgi:sarcosine oxidase|nr:FAD-dependent oxidoreductase [Frankiaceae bacterium]
MRTDLLVVGGGAMGSATAWWAARAGRDVTLLERHQGHHVHGSSHGRARIFRLAYADGSYVAMAREAYGLWRLLERESGASLLHVTGGLDHGSAVDDVEANLRAHGLPYARLRAGEAAERWPALRFETDVVHQPDAGRLDADAAVETLHAEAARHGAEVRFGVTVLGARETAYGVAVATTAGEWEARVAVVAAGAWLPGLLGSLPLPDDLPPFRVTQEQPVYLPSDAQWPSFIHHRGDDVAYYGLGTPGEGVKLGEHGSGRAVDPDARLGVDADAVRRVEAYAAEWLPGATPSATRADSCLYTTTPDESFVLRRRGALVVCSPCSGHGFKFVPEIGRRTAALSG